METKYYTIQGFLGGVFIFHDKDALRAWIDGAKHTLWAFGIWKDGEVFVGSSGKTFAEAMKVLTDQYEATTGEKYKDD